MANCPSSPGSLKEPITAEQRIVIEAMMHTKKDARRRLCHISEFVFLLDCCIHMLEELKSLVNSIRILSRRPPEEEIRCEIPDCEDLLLTIIGLRESLNIDSLQDIHNRMKLHRKKLALEQSRLWRLRIHQ
jgi:hypothetical protein